MTLESFVKKYNGKSVDLDGFPKNQPYQCFDLIGAYCREVIGMKGTQYQMLPVAGAKDIYLQFPKSLQKYFQKVPATSGGRAGDIVVWGAGLAGSGGYGHTALMLSPSKGSFISLDQNWGGAYVHQVSHNYNQVLGYLRPILQNAPNAPKAPLKAPPTPAPVYYIVRRGDYLSAIANRLKVSLGRLIGLNHIKNPNLIYAGQKLRVK